MTVFSVSTGDHHRHPRRRPCAAAALTAALSTATLAAALAAALVTAALVAAAMPMLCVERAYVSGLAYSAIV